MIAVEEKPKIFSKAFNRILIGWFLMGVSISLMLSLVIPEEALLDIHLYPHLSSKVSHSALFVLTCVVYLVTLPISTWLLYRYCYNYPLKKLKAKVVVIFLLLVTAPIAIDAYPASDNTKYDVLINAAAYYGDWFGVSVVVYIYICLSSILISMATTRGGHQGKCYSSAEDINPQDK